MTQAKKWSQGYYTPRHPEKYVGNVNKIVYRSSWEQKLNIFLDNNPNILLWSSEPFAIPYLKPTTQQIHKYYPDYWIKYRNKKGEIVQEVIEVKPSKQKTRSRSRNPKQRLYEDLVFAINTAKWQAAQQWCKKRGLKFRIVDEMELFK